MTQPTSPPAEQVNKFHSNSDKDSAKTAGHHSLGIDANQASPGDHKHDGKTSKRILDGFTITGDRSDGSALISVIDALQQLGATDSTVP